MLSALDASVSVSALAMWPAHLCSSFRLSLFGSIFDPVHQHASFCVSFFPTLCWSCFFCFSQSCGVRHHFRSPCCHLFLPVSCWVPCWCSHITLGQTALASASILLLKVVYGQHSAVCHFLHVSCACFMRCCTDGSFSAATCKSRRVSLFCPRHFCVSRLELFCDVAVATMSSACATLGKYHSSHLKPDSSLFQLLAALCPPIVSTPWGFLALLMGAPGCFDFFDSKCPYPHLQAVLFPQFLKSMPSAVCRLRVLSLLSVLGFCPHGACSACHQSAVRPEQRVAVFHAG